LTVATILRSRTRREHVRTEAIYAPFDLQDRDGYARFLIAQASASFAVEQSLESAGVTDVVGDWAERRRAHLLSDDLSQLNVASVRLQPPSSFGSSAEIMGAVYVLEGSRLGGKILRKRVFDTAPTRFLGAEGKPGAWRDLLTSLNLRLRDKDEIQSAVTAARGVFATFEKAGREAAEICIEH
jgi:heme oxygenase (biliverdin-IX-beta and delta-forming)